LTFGLDEAMPSLEERKTLYVKSQKREREKQGEQR
jgi:hypothetical protein